MKNFIKCRFDNIGLLSIAEENGRITDLRFGDHPWNEDAKAAETPVLLAARGQLEEYLEGTRRSFDLPLAPSGTDFQLRCWDELSKIPYGAAVSYGYIARAIGSPSASRAVGAACKKNPIVIVIPCHRVIGSDGSLTGFGGGLDVKSFLLMHEARILNAQR